MCHSFYRSENRGAVRAREQQQTFTNITATLHARPSDAGFATGSLQPFSSGRGTARWQLATRDRLDSNEFRMMQEFISNTLGVRREMVHKAAGTLQKEGLIIYTRGILTILDEAGLEAASCECYRIVTEEYDNVLG